MQRRHKMLKARIKSRTSRSTAWRQRQWETAKADREAARAATAKLLGQSAVHTSRDYNTSHANAATLNNELNSSTLNNKPNAPTLDNGPNPSTLMNEAYTITLLNELDASTLNNTPNAPTPNIESSAPKSEAQAVDRFRNHLDRANREHKTRLQQNENKSRSKIHEVTNEDNLVPFMPKLSRRFSKKLPKHHLSKLEPSDGPISDIPPKEANTKWKQWLRPRFASLESEKLMQIRPLETEKIPQLAHNLDRALFLPGVHYFQDPRTRIYNFPPFLKNIIKHQDFDFESIAPFRSVSKDEQLLAECQRLNKTFYLSTSSMTLALSQLYMVLNNYNPTHKNRFDFAFRGISQKIPASIFMVPKGKNKNGETIYALEADKSADNEILLSAMGHCMEALLTTKEADFERHRKGGSRDPGAGPLTNTYNYASVGDFVLRLQLDCYDARLPGNGTFDLKTRAALLVRHDSANPHIENNHYQIYKLDGMYELFAREWDDLVCLGALLKYGFQARIGQMDGIYVAYHNVNTFFGFQYVPLSEIDRVYYSHRTQNNPAMMVWQLEKVTAEDLDKLPDKLPTYVAEAQFRMGMQMYQDVLRHVLVATKETEHDGPYRIVMRSNYRARLDRTDLGIHVQPVTFEQMDTLQKFLGRFRTSFREEISADERNENLLQHRNDLSEYNRQLAGTSPVYNLWLEVREHIVDGKKQMGPSPYPHAVGAELKVVYDILRVPPTPHFYLKALSHATNSLGVVSGLAESKKNAHEIYQRLGRARRLLWLEKDSEPVTYNAKEVN